jgi:hypothetical protein
MLTPELTCHATLLTTRSLGCHVVVDFYINSHSVVEHRRRQSLCGFETLDFATTLQPFTKMDPIADEKALLSQKRKRTLDDQG